jgi:hypothetical protein
VRGSGVAQRVEIAPPSNALSFFLNQGLLHSIHMATTCCLVDGHDDNPPDTENDIDTSSHIFLPRRFLFYIFDYPRARAKYPYHVARLSLSVVRHSFPLFFASKLLFAPAPSLPSTSTSIMRAFANRQSLLSTSFTDYGRSYYLTTFYYPPLYDRRCCYISASLSFPFLLSVFLSISRYHIYRLPNMMMVYIRASAPPTR